MLPHGARTADTNPEIFLAVAVIALAVVAAHFRFRWLGCWEGPLARLSRRKRLAIFLAGVLPLVVRAVLLPVFPPPEPRVHDEFSFLLAADTFLHGRLVNPPHPFWVHFESVHILSQPVYASAFPIGPAAALAVGKLLFGHWWAGVWLSSGLMCAAICWMLQGWLPPRWALLGALLLIFRLAISSYWMNSYWGGSLAAAAGALVLGALPRIRKSARPRDALWMSIGLAVLANTRPVEGAVFSLMIAVALLAWMLGKHGPPRRVALRSVIVPLALTLALAALGTGYYFARVTGKPWVAPYVLYRNTMSIAPHFIWQRPAPEPLYNNRELRNFYVYWEMGNYDVARNWQDLPRKLSFYWRFYLGPLLSIPLLSIVALWRSPMNRPLLWMAAGFSTVLIGQVWHNPHYAAPATGLAILIVMVGMRYLRLWRRRNLWGVYLVRSLPLACAAMLVIQVVSGRQQNDKEFHSWRWPLPGNTSRAGLLEQLEHVPGDHLAFVRYGLGHDLGEEWVYNGADIDHARVVWARVLDGASNSALMRYFSARKVWLVEPDLPSPRAIPYEEAPMQPMPFVQLGAPAIEVLRSPNEVRQRVLEKSGAGPATLFSCDAWNFYFTEATGVAGPGVSAECYGPGARNNPVSFARWFAWLQRQR